MKTVERIRVGLIGCGYQGQWIAKAIDHVDDLSLIACFDPDAQALQALTGSSNGAVPRVTASAEALIADHDVDAIILATPHLDLQPLALAAINSGKHVLVEKPVALDAREGRALEAAAAGSDLVAMSGYSFRYFPLPALARRLLLDGKIGQIRTLVAIMTVPGLRPGWPSEHGAGGGMMGFFGCHMIDRVLWYLGDSPSEIFGRVRRNDAGADLAATFQLGFAGGALAQFNLCSGVKGPFDSLQVFGTEGQMSLVADTFTCYRLAVSGTSDSDMESSSDNDRPQAILEMMSAELRDFAGAILERKAPPITVSDGVRVLDVIDAVVRSHYSGLPVTPVRNLQ